MCAVCGTPIDEKETDESTGTAKLSMKKVTIVAAAMAVIALAVVIAVGKSGDVRHEPPAPEREPERMEHGGGIRLPASMEAESEFEEVTEPNSETETQSETQEGWISVVDRYKRIECVIPKSFERARDDWGMTILNSKEGNASIIIAVVEGVQFENAEAALALLCSEMAGGVAAYSNFGEGWYEAEFINGRMTIHRKCFVESDAIRYFEFQFPTERGEYRESIAYMMENFKLIEAEEEETETVVSE